MPNKNLSISSAWIFRSESGEIFDPVMFPLLKGIHDSGKLTKAAAEVGLSYRHAWNLLNRWADFFGLPLVVMRKGHGTTLSKLGEKIMWAEHRVTARLGPQIDSMASELNEHLQQLLAGAHPVLRLHASHGYAVALLSQFSHRLEINIQYCSPKDALLSLKRGDSDIASFHLPTSPELARRSLAYYQELLQGDDLRVIRFVTRQQGLIIRGGGASTITGLKDLTRTDHRFINRNGHSGTRILFNMLLEKEGIAENQIPGFEREEYTHSAVAAHVAAGMADAGFGVEAAARQFGLDFIPLATERYLMVCREGRLAQHNTEQLLTLMRSPEFAAEINKLPGYSPEYCGTVCTIAELNPD
ncbi:MAG TPA: LysR family transcriptional regulator [Pseudomonas xinjiangensis]|uniref:LysR family transcriptional regulator n=2 Tax=root TaxID=1 RepID=A0A7V1BR64_9GAMM|nr:LysR family transcriptional regulator [Halopseudomonas xinjiangensis]HEC47880.1 LysR family transcriptional regulator [Halopseudomonas xinjiangensis]